jgi:hypothetical protein
VDWFNVVDATYRSELRELNELHYARFGARLEQRLAELEARIDTRLAELEARINARFEHLSAEFRTELAAQRADLIKWSFLFWLGMVVTVFVSRSPPILPPGIR